MLAYKFRSSEQIVHALDIIFNSRLFCADWTCLNDPMEGVFQYSQTGDGTDDMDEISEIIRSKKRRRICALSTTFDNFLLWAHYANGFDGLAIEVDYSGLEKLDRYIRWTVDISRDGRGRALDNIFVERLWRSVKYEEVYLCDYQSVAEAKNRISAYLRFYNQERLHQALGYRTPGEVYRTNC